MARDAVVRLMANYSDATDHHVVVVFDGKSGRACEDLMPDGIQVFYSKEGQTADAVIERLVAKYAKENEIIVATGDMMEQQTVISFGALAITPDDLFARLENARVNLSRRIEKLRRRALND
jgi:predicted RNA-binding protein with PIN domain